MKWIIVVVGVAVSGNGNAHLLQESDPSLYPTEASCLKAVELDSQKPLRLPPMNEPMKWRGFCLKVPDIPLGGDKNKGDHRVSKPGEDSI